MPADPYLHMVLQSNYKCCITLITTLTGTDESGAYVGREYPDKNHLSVRTNYRFNYGGNIQTLPHTHPIQNSSYLYFFNNLYYVGEKPNEWIPIVKISFILRVDAKVGGSSYRQ